MFDDVTRIQHIFRANRFCKAFINFNKIKILLVYCRNGKWTYILKMGFIPNYFCYLTVTELYLFIVLF